MNLFHLVPKLTTADGVVLMVKKKKSIKQHSYTPYTDSAFNSK